MCKHTGVLDRRGQNRIIDYIELLTPRSTEDHKKNLCLFCLPRALVRGLWLIILIFLSQQAKSFQDNSVDILQSDVHGMTLELSTPQFSTNKIYLKGKKFQRLSIPGYGSLSEEGKPELPMKGILLSVPSQAEVSLETSGSGVSVFSGLSIYPARGERSDTYFSHNRFYPGKLAVMGLSGYLRDVRVAQLCIYPVQYNAFRKELKFYRKIRVTVKFVNAKQAEFTAPSITPHSSSIEWNKIYKNTIANYQSLDELRVTNRDTQHATRNTQSPSCKLIVDSDGVYQLTYRDLEEAGIDPRNINSKTLSLTNKGKSVPIFVSGENDGRFDKLDSLLFYGKFNRGSYSLYGEYTINNVYWLSWGERKGARMTSLDVSFRENTNYKKPSFYRTVAHFEKDKFRAGLGYVDAKRDFWCWDRANSREFLEYEFQLHDVIKNGTCKIRVMLHGQSLSEHHTKIWVNGAMVSDARWNGQRKQLHESQDIPCVLLEDGENILRLESVGDTPAGDSDVVLFNWFEIEYYRKFKAVDDKLAFEIEEPGAYQFKLTGFSHKAIEIYRGESHKLVNYEVFREDDSYSVRFFDEIVAPTKYLAITYNQKKKPELLASDFSQGKNEPAQLRSPTNSADYIFIVYDDFYEEILPLVRHRGKRFRTTVVKVSDIYDEFSDGLLSPEAIRDFLRYAYFHWQRPRPSYVLLVGDANWNFKHGKNYVPAYYFNSFKWGQAATDNLYACVNGDDPLPDLFIGRIPTRTKEDTKAVVEKILRYENNPHFGTWRRNLLMLAAKGSFERDSESLIDDYTKPPNSGYKVRRVYTNENSKYYGTTEQLLDFWNEGVGFVHFTGHGGGAIWSDEKLFTFDDVQFLQNENMPAFVTSFTCFTGYFDHPNRSCLNEQFLQKEEGGAIAAFGATGLGWLKGDYYMEQALFESLFTNNKRQAGKVIVEAKVNLMVSHRYYTDMVNLYNLLGDPAVFLPLPHENIEMTAKLEKNNRIKVRGIIHNTDVPQTYQGLLEVESQAPQIKYPKTELSIEDSKFDATITPDQQFISNSGELGYPGKEMSIRCYAFNSSIRNSSDAAGAFPLKMAGENDIDLSLFSDDIAFSKNDEDAVEVQATVFNLGQKEASNVLVYFYAGNPFSGGFRIGEDVIPKIPGGSEAKAEIEYQPKSESQLFYVQVDPENKITELNEANNIAEKTLVFYVFTITPQEGSGGYIDSRDGNLTLKIESNAVKEPVMFSIESMATPSLSTQPALEYAPLENQESEKKVYRLSIKRSKPDIFLPDTFASLTFHYNSTLEKLSIYQYRQDLQQWQIIPHQSVDKRKDTVSGKIPLTQKMSEGQPQGLFSTFALMLNSDKTPPLIQLTLSDEQLVYDREYASKNPTLSAAVSDANGVGEILFFLNNEQIESSELIFSHSINNVTVSFTPTLEEKEYQLLVEAFDLSGNSSTETLLFRVGEKAKLLRVANYPNPFSDETYFTYVLTKPAEEVKIKIYTTSGRLISELVGDVRRGYNEIRWDGTDRNNEQVANGAYFYKISVETDEKRLKKVGKLLVHR